MLEVMFVEKRKALIRSYRQMLHWESYGFKILSTTDKEQQAISYYGEYKHDLIFLDLDLKSGDGFSLIRKLKALHANCLIVVLSEQEDYQSVHDAFRLGVYEYILKKNMRVSVLSDLLNEIQAYYHAQSNDGSWRKEMEHLLGRFRDHGEIDDSAIDRLFDNPTFSLLKQPYQMIYFRMDNVRQINRKLKIYDQPDWISEEDNLKLYAARLAQRETLQHQLEEVIHSHVDTASSCLLFIKKHSGVILVPSITYEDIKTMTQQLQRSVIQRCQSDFSFTIGSTTCGKDQFFSALTEVMTKHKDRFYIGDGCLLLAQEEHHYHHLGEKDRYFQQKIMKELQRYDGEGCLRSVHSLLLAMKKNHIQPDEVIQYCLDLFTKMEDFLSNKGFHDFTLQKEAVFESETFAFLSFELDRIFKTLRDELEAYICKSTQVVEQMIKYIDTHLHEKLDVETISIHAGATLSSAYASKLIKQKTGFPMLQLILKKRMEKAADLLLKTDLKIKQVSEMVGYVDQLYFNKAFRKFFGMSPSLYRTRHM